MNQNIIHTTPLFDNNELINSNNIISIVNKQIKLFTN